MVRRPKSIATVVVVLPSMPSMSSTPMPRSESTSSVFSGLISLIAPTMVVFPTPNPPATRIFSATGSSEGPESIDHFLENALTRARSHRGGGGDRDEAVVAQVAEEYPDDADRQVELDGHVGHRDGGAGREEDGLLLGTEAAGREPCRAYGRDQVEGRARGPGATSGERVRPDEWSGLLVHPPRPVHDEAARGFAEMCWPTRLTSIAIS